MPAYIELHVYIDKASILQLNSSRSKRSVVLLNLKHKFLIKARLQWERDGKFCLCGAFKSTVNPNFIIHQYTQARVPTCYFTNPTGSSIHIKLDFDKWIKLSSIKRQEVQCNQYLSRSYMPKNGRFWSRICSCHIWITDKVSTWRNWRSIVFYWWLRSWGR